MPIYEYKGVTTKGKAAKGTLDAENPRALRALLKRQEVYLSEYAATNAAGDGSKAMVAGGVEKAASGRDVNFKKLFQRVRVMDVAIMTRQMATLLRAGIPMIDSLSALIDQTENPKLARIMTEVRRAVNEGSSLAGAMAEHPDVFSKLYTNMIRAGETSGKLDVVCARLAVFTEKEVELKSKVMGALLYPIIMMVLAFGIVLMLLVFLVPKMAELFDMLDTQIPPMTRAMLTLSRILTGWWWAILLGMGLVVFLVRHYIKTDAGLEKWDALKLKLPVFGKLTRMISVARFSRTLGTLLNSGVPVLSAMGIVKNIITNSVLNKVIDEARDAIKEGESISAPLKRSGQFPPMVTYMIAIGEKSGHLEEMLNNVADAYETEVETKIAALTSLLTPIIIVFMGVVVAVLALSFLQPIMEMNEALMRK